MKRVETEPAPVQDAERPSRSSLRRRVLVFLAPAVVGVWLAFAATATWETYREAEAVLDESLAQVASVIFSLVAHELLEHAADVGDGRELPWVAELRAHLPERLPSAVIAFQVDNGPVRLRSPGAPLAPMSDGAVGFSDHLAHGQRWRVYTFHDTDTGVTVRVGERVEHRARILDGMLEKLALPLLIGVPTLGVSIWLSVGRGLAPLHRIAALVQRRDPSHLSPLGVRDPPAELAPLVSALDRLLSRLDAALDAERRFTADAAHELRTPLTAIRAQAQVALRARDDGGRTRALGQLIAGVDRATRLVEQLLALSRLDAGPAIAAAGAPTEVGAAARKVVAVLAGAACAKDIRLGLHAPGPAWVDVADYAVEALLRNLVDNAIRYTPRGGRVDVVVGAPADVVRVQVDDSGPGIAPGDRERVVQRFQRGAATDAPGSGLGLSIVARLAVLAGAALRLGESDSGGLSAVVDLPASSAKRAKGAHDAGPPRV